MIISPFLCAEDLSNQTSVALLEERTKTLIFIDKCRMDMQSYLKKDDLAKVQARLARLVEKIRELAALEKDSDSLKEYSNKLLWELVITPADIVKAHEVKQRSIGFVKLFGSQSMKALYGHLSAVRNNKARKYPNTRWVREMPQKTMLKRV
ncbi:hypothetical protein BV898_17020 [Hypsibius exemplaris]|uniref:Uncharacterized protein n=1 Tax=Hypsibius exemplaris TaxID=2072580 RepID=A0A9X6NMX2_HYPEX|nr:hypothetical protein BV898_17020 [Hypsibius exemplaris]